MKFSWQMQHKHTFIDMYLEKKKEMIDKKIKMETKLTNNVFSVVAYSCSGV